MSTATSGSRTAQGSVGPEAGGESPIAAPLIAWQRRHGRRDLPWQREPTPYRVWVSEIMLQQTQVATVIGYYERFMRRFPDIATLAVAEVDAVLHVWSGLGYYSRARNLQRTARIVCREHAGELPCRLDELMGLPGIGRSTAAAILAFSRGLRHPILDGNVRRVLARYFGIAGPAQARATEQALWVRAEQCTPRRDVGLYTQAIMDLGATLCTRHQPRCADCPVRAGCVAHTEDRIGELPARRVRPTRRLRRTVMLLAQRRDGAVLLRRRPERGVWGGLWTPLEFPSTEAAEAFCATRFGSEPGKPATLASIRHAFTHFDLQITPILARCHGLSVMEGQDVLWYNAREPAHVGLPAPIAQLLKGVAERIG